MEIGFAISYGSRKSQRHYSVIYLPIRMETWNRNPGFKLDKACHRDTVGLHLRILHLVDKCKGGWACWGWGIAFSTIQGCKAV